MIQEAKRRADQYLMRTDCLQVGQLEICLSSVRVLLHLHDEGERPPRVCVVSLVEDGR